MTVRRKEALKELATAIAESTVDAWLAGDIADDGLDTNTNDKGINHGKQHRQPPRKQHPPKAR
jgi:hypothetical protein